jgi:hypothetical protein
MPKQMNAASRRSQTAGGPGCAVPSCTARRAAVRTADDKACASCVERLADDLARMPGLYRACEEALTPATRGLTEKVCGGRRFGGVALDGAALSARSSMMTILSSWAGYVADRRRLSARPHRDVTALADFLLSHLTWLSTQPAIQDAAGEFHEVVRGAEKAVDPCSDRLDLGPCDHPGCGARVYADIGSGGEVGCDRGHRRGPSEWLLLRRRRDTTHNDASDGTDADAVARSAR